MCALLKKNVCSYIGLAWMENDVWPDKLQGPGAIFVTAQAFLYQAILINEGM